MKTTKREIGHRIGAALSNACVLQKDLAKAVGVSQSTISSAVNGDRYLYPDQLALVAKRLSVSVEWLITGEDQQNCVKVTPTKEDALRLVLTSDPQLVEKIKDDLRHQIQEETPAYQSRLTSNETRLLKAFALLDARRQERLIDTAEDMSVALLRGSDQEEKGGGSNCAESNGK